MKEIMLLVIGLSLLGAKANAETMTAELEEGGGVIIEDQEEARAPRGHLLRGLQAMFVKDLKETYDRSADGVPMGRLVSEHARGLNADRGNAGGNGAANGNNGGGNGNGNNGGGNGNGRK